MEQEECPPPRRDGRNQAIKRAGDLYKMIDVLARDVGILGVGSDPFTCATL